MRYWLDTEFIEDGKTIDLISIGIVAEDGRELHLGNRECDFNKASDWVVDNVLLPMGFERMPKCEWREGFMKPVDPAFWVSRDVIKCDVAEFLEAVPSIDTELNVHWGLKDGVASPTMWGEWCSYDWVAFAQIFGTMMDLPSGFPMRINDVMQLKDMVPSGKVGFPESLETAGNHNALLGAKTVQARWQWCMEAIAQ